MTRSAPAPAPALWTEAPELREGPVARVAMLAGVDGEYSFAVPAALAGQVEPGRRVLVPFGRSREPQPAFCVSVGTETWNNTLKPIAAVLDEERLLPDQLLDLGRWISRYYSCPLGRALSAMVPEAIRKQSGFRTVRHVRLAAGQFPISDFRFPNQQRSIVHGSSRTKIALYSDRSPVQGRSTPNHSEIGNRKSEIPPPRLSKQRRAVLAALAAAPDGLDLDDLLARRIAGRGVVHGMVRDGLLEMTEHREPAPAPNYDETAEEPPFALNPEQQAAITRITRLACDPAAAGFRAILLFGVSGSGKTEVYVHAIRAAVAAGRQAILLVPEIALTTQLVHRLVRRFRDVAVIHSGQTGVQRSLTWAAIARGEKRVIIGTRSAVFAPCPNLGLIIVDEEQEGSYKNQQSPRFHTRDVALKRAHLAGIPIVLGSATPSLETWNNCDRLPHFERITLHQRIADLPLPEVEFIDLRTEQQERKGVHLLSRRMEAGLQETLAAGRQAVLLLNRRGYANYLVCSRCRTLIVCPNCRTNMVFHQATGKAACHYCTAKLIMPKRCGDASCGGTLIRFGMGTERLEEELKAKFPQARLLRADSDVLTKVEHYETLMQDFHGGCADILLGTQMIAKGLDFPNVSFVGVINADSAAAIPDFRSAERTFQMVTQVAGRAGRKGDGSPSSSPKSSVDDEPCLSSGKDSRPPSGRAVVQSLQGLSKPLRFALQHDYAGFAAAELDIRRQFGWPPFSRLARVIVSHRTESQARTAAEALAEAVRGHLSKGGLRAEVMGPQTAPLARLRNQYRYDFVIRAADAGRLMETLERLRHDGVLTPNTKHALVDVDPVSLM